jgi:hypothetical protein
MLCLRRREDLPAHAEKLLAYLLRLADASTASS